MHSPWQLDELKNRNRELEDDASRLAKSNEKLADDEGRWYALAKELEGQMDMMKKVSLGSIC